MKIKYHFVDETVEIEVSDEWGDILIDLDRQEYNNNHTETRRHYHLDGCVYEGADFAVEDKALAALIEDMDIAKHLPQAIRKLPADQQKLIRELFYKRVTLTEYAKQNGISQPAATKRKQKALKNLKNILSLWL